MMMHMVWCWWKGKLFPIQQEIIKRQENVLVLHETKQRLLRYSIIKASAMVWVGDNNYAWKTFQADIVDVPPLYMISIKCFRVRKKLLRHKNKSTQARSEPIWQRLFNTCKGRARQSCGCDNVSLSASSQKHNIFPYNQSPEKIVDKHPRIVCLSAPLALPKLIKNILDEEENKWKH